MTPLSLCAARSSAALAGCLLLGAAASAQTIRGTVLDESTSAVLRSAYVRLLPADRDTVLAIALTQNGSFELRVPDAGGYRLRVEALGYTSLTTDALAVSANSDITVELRISVNAIPLEPLRVVADRDRMEPWYMEDIRWRQNLGFGRFLMREDLEVRESVTLVEVLRTVPGVRVVMDNNPRSTVPPMVITRAGLVLGECAAALYLNGVRQFAHGGLPLDLERARDFFEIRPSDIEVIEVYRGAAEVPGEYGGPTAECGVVAIWLRTGWQPRTADEQFVDVTPLRARMYVTASRSQISGRHAPDDGLNLDVSVHWTIVGPASLGLRVQRATHDLPADITQEITRGLSPSFFELPPGTRPLQLWLVGLEPRVVLPELSIVRPFVASRFQIARRSFSVTELSRSRNTSFGSRGWGVGVGVGFDVHLAGRVSATVALDLDWLFMGKFGTLERRTIPTAADWRSTSLRVGLGYAFAR